MGLALFLACGTPAAKPAAKPSPKAEPTVTTPGPPGLVQLRWRTALGSRVYAQPRWLSPACLLVAPSAGPALCLDPQTGRTLQPFATPGTLATPAASGDSFVFATQGAGVLAFDDRGQQRWRWPLPGVGAADVAAHRGLLLVGGDGLFALHADGRWAWHVATALPVYAAPASAADGSLWQGTGEGELLQLDAQGTVLQRLDAGGSLQAGVAACPDGGVVTANLRGQVMRWSAAGEMRWRFSTHAPIVATPACNGAGVLAGNTAGKLWALSADGQLRWQQQLSGSVRHAVRLDAAGHIFVGSVDGTLWGLTPQGHVLWQLPMDEHIDSALELGPDGTLYLALADGSLAALR